MAKYPRKQPTICHSFAEVTRLNWKEFQSSANVGLPLAEESITDYLLLRLKERNPNSITIRKFNKRQEPKTGADWEWWLGSQGSWFGFRVQAKVLDEARMEYSSLDCKGGAQLDTLLRDAAANNLEPIYCFYNPVANSAVMTRWNCSTYSMLVAHLACTIANGFAVKARLYSHGKSYADMQGLCLPLMCLVCCNGCNDNQMVLAERARIAAGQLRNIAGAHNAIHDVPDLPEICDVLPDYVLQEIESGDGDKYMLSSLESESEQRLAGILVVSE